MRHRIVLLAVAWLAACGERVSSRADSSGRIAESVVEAKRSESAGTLAETLANTMTNTMTAATKAGGAQPLKPYANVEARGLSRAAGGADGRRYVERPAAVPGVIVGVVKGGSPRDTSIAPTHDLSVCKPFTEAQVPSKQGGVGNAVVWLEGVTEGPKDDAPRRVKLTLDGCHLEPRVQRVAAGGTVLVNSRDAMMSRLQFVAAGETVSRAAILLTDAGQIVPTSDVTMPPALVEVRDDRHPWVRGWLAIAPHPFVAVTQADGQFRFDNVPPGKYTLVVWQEKLGARKTTVRVEAGVQAGVEVVY
jgi:hypothetical protein